MLTYTEAIAVIESEGELGEIHGRIWREEMEQRNVVIILIS